MLQVIFYQEILPGMLLLFYEKIVRLVMTTLMPHNKNLKECPFRL
jgi:hypothetical protein